MRSRHLPHLDNSQLKPEWMSGLVKRAVERRSDGDLWWCVAGHYHGRGFSGRSIGIRNAQRDGVVAGLVECQRHIRLGRDRLWVGLHVPLVSERLALGIGGAGTIHLDDEGKRAVSRAERDLR